MPDKFNAIWLSHSSISAFQNCPRAYYLSYIYRDSRSGNKISLITPHMALGSAVHEVLESLSVLPTAKRFEISLIDRFQSSWKKISGERGGFADNKSEEQYKKRGEDMLRRIMNHSGPLKEKAVKIKMELPQYWISEEDNLILCGKLDWLEYNESNDSINILDFKTGTGKEKVNSLQLPIYYLLAHNCQTREVKKASYWYLSSDDVPVEQKLPDLDSSKELVVKVGKEIKLARALERFKCPDGEAGCHYCTPFEKILKGEATFVGNGDYGNDIYALLKSGNALPESEVL
jgi:ATP-dependent helicase/DNAse subunit B